MKSSWFSRIQWLSHKRCIVGEGLCARGWCSGINIGSGGYRV